MQNTGLLDAKADKRKMASPLNAACKVAPAAVIPRWKRILDISLILAASPLIVPLAAIIALVIKSVSRGGVIFRQERVGFVGQPFTCFKFRTMEPNAATTAHQGYLKVLMQSDQPMTKMDLLGDARLIPFGSILRSSGLDELPQLINVIRGEMSLVGPRPCLPYEYANYLPWQKARFNSLPGLTGLWQVSGKNRTTFNEMIKMDITYAEKKSIVLDAVILLKTIPTLMLQMLEMLTRRKRVAKSPASSTNA